MIRKKIMKQVYAYPAVVKKVQQGYMFFIPDLLESVFEQTLPEGIEKCREMIGRMAVEMERENLVIEPPTGFKEAMQMQEKNSLVIFIDVDFEEFRRRMSRQAVHKNVTIPAWMEWEAEWEGLNYSALLQEAIRAKLKHLKFEKD